MGLSQGSHRDADRRSGSDGPGFGGLPEPIDLSAYHVPDGGAGVLAGPTAGAGGNVPLGLADAALRGLRRVDPVLTGVGDAPCQLGEADLGEAATLLLAVQARAERSLVLVLADALARGVVDASDAGGPQQWLTDRRAHLEPAAASRMVKAAKAINQPVNASLRAALVAGDVGVAALVVAVEEVPKAMVVLPDASRDEVLGYYLGLWESGRRSSKDLRDLTKAIIAEYGEDKLPNDEQKSQDVESLRWSELPSGLFELMAILSPGHAAQVIEAINALGKPKSTTDPVTGETVRDERTPGKRRADALMELVGAAARVGDPYAMRSTAKMIVTMGLDTLLRKLRQGGYAVTATGRILDAGSLRRLACNADLIPAVLGSDSQPLDVGREERTFVGGVRTAIMLRDKHCTFPGCDRPPGWCEAHHAIPWWVGGQSDFLNGTLLCSRHHHVVHSKGYMPKITKTEVVWDLTPGRMPEEPPGTLADTA